SLLGLGNLAALPEAAARDLRLDRDLSRVRELRRRLAELPDTQEGQPEKRRLLAESRAAAERATRYADLVAGGWLAATRPGRDQATRVAERIAGLAQQVAGGDDPAAFTEQAAAWLKLDLPRGAFTRRPLHWPLVFPEVFEDGGFDAIIGNPPFLGGTKITGSLGVAYREYLCEMIAQGIRAGGRCDLVAYFVLRAHELLNWRGQTGLIATNTLAQGDTREVGLDQLVASGVTIRRAVKSKPWPSKSAALEYCAIWTSLISLGEGVRPVADDVPVKAITASLDSASRSGVNPHRLATNSGLVFQGSKLDGIGFAVDPAYAIKMIDRDPRNREVLFPYLNGKDLNSEPNCAAARWVINFHEWDLAKAEAYTEPFAQVVRLVKPARASHGEQRVRDAWWRFQRSRPELYAAIADLDRVIAITLVSKTVMPEM